MKRIDTPDKRFHDGNKQTGTKGTKLKAEWFNHVQEEMAAILAHADMEPDPSKKDQVVGALKKRFVGKDNDGNVAVTGTLSIGGKNLSPYAGFKNRAINGNFAVNQLGLSGTVALSAGEYGHDGFKAGAGGCTYTFSTSENVTTVTIKTGSLIQTIDGANLDSGTHTLSWAGTAQGKIGAGGYGNSGVTGDVVGGVNINIEFGLGTLSQVQFERGRVPTTFEHILYQTDLMRCQWYYEQGSFKFASIVSVGTGNRSTLTLKTPKRTAPTVTLSNESKINIGPTRTDGITDSTIILYWIGTSSSVMGIWSADYTASSRL